MKKMVFLTFISLLNIPLFSQRKEITGIITSDTLFIKDVHIVNLNTNLGTISNNKGIFTITVQQNDTLLLSHLNYKNKKIIITDTLNNNFKLKVKLIENVAQLKGFTLQKNLSIFYNNKQLKNDKEPIVNAKTLKLPYAKLYKKPNTEIVKLPPGGVLSIANLVNTLNGSKKRKKIVEKLAKKDRELQKIRNYFTDAFFTTDLKILKEHINPFLNFCLKKNIITIFKRGETIKITKILIQESKLFLRKNKY